MTPFGLAVEDVGEAGWVARWSQYLFVVRIGIEEPVPVRQVPHVRNVGFIARGSWHPGVGWLTCGWTLDMRQ